MAWQPTAFLVFALLPDNEIYNAATADGQELWTLGDVFEIFIRRENSPVYLELHVTPNNYRLHLRLTSEDFERIRERKAKLNDFMGDAKAFEADVKQMPARKIWLVFARIPASILPNGSLFESGDKLQLSFSRYDTDREGQNAVLSSTSPHEKLSFHRRHEWRTVTLE